MANPFLTLPYESAIADLGTDYSDRVLAAEFPQHLLRFRNDDLLPRLGLEPQQVQDEDFIEAFGYFQSVTPFLALRYHGYQFGEYNPYLGDGRGFLYGQVRGNDGNLYDFGTKGSGQTPYSRTADGCLTLKGGVREVLAAEALHHLGVSTSRALSLIETGESLWRGDEPSPTRSSVMVRFSQSHIRFGTFERLHYIQRPDLIPPLLDHIITIYYPEIPGTGEERYILFYQALVQRVATLAAQWMVAGFCHGVLNTDNMSITGESFDYGPYAFIPAFDPKFTPAYFDYGRRYCYGNQPGICRLNLELLQVPLRMVMDKQELEVALDRFENHYFETYRALMVRRLGMNALPLETAHELVKATVKLLIETQVDYGGFFARLARQFNPQWRQDATLILPQTDEQFSEVWQMWRQWYHQALTEYPPEVMLEIQARLKTVNPQTTLVRPEIEAVWEAIAQEDNWQPFNDLLIKLATRT
ncbi:MAG: YdiU family protein [Spirulina sp. SIO3F2]|nr:YdiU family protein [Spirulina sp. SIO3F2]